MIRENITMQILENMNAESNSYIANTPPRVLILSFQRNTIPAPPTMPETAPGIFVLFQKREKSIIGPKVAPKPARIAGSDFVARVIKIF